MLLSALASLLLAVDLNPKSAAVIARDQAKAQAQVTEKYGNRKPSEMTQDERRAMVKDQLEADKKVLEKHGVDLKDWARYEIRQGRDEREQQKQAEKALAEKEKADAQPKPAEPQEVQIQRGISDAEPVVLEEKESDEPRIDQGLPADAVADQDAARGGAPSEAPKIEAGKGGDDAKKGAGGKKK